MSNHELGASTWDEYVGQREIRELCEVEISAVIKGSTPEKPLMFPHTLFSAFPGAGKTTLAKIIANELEDHFISFVMPVSPKVIESTVRTIQEGSILFLDEIHKASTSQQESFLTLMEEGYFQTMSGIKFEIEHLTVLAATTRPDMLDPAFKDRFILSPKFVPYTVEDLTEIATVMARKAEVPMDNDMLEGVGAASAGTPRNARRLILAAQSLLRHLGEMPDFDRVLRHAGIRRDGITSEQVEYLTLLHKFNGVAGVNKIASAMQLNSSAMPIIERYLFDSNLIDFTDRGRCLTAAGTKTVKDILSS